jgi:hypothetical protein
VSLFIFVQCCNIVTQSIVELVDRMLIGMVGGKRKVVLNDWLASVKTTKE